MPDNMDGMNSEEFNDNQNDDENPYDSNFDAGVEADEEQDPKKYIEQLSGKLSQSLNAYQKNLPKPDSETAKYAAGMVIKAAIKGLDEKDINDILNKLKDKDDEDDNNISNNTDDADLPNDNEKDFNDDGIEESKKYNLDEIFQELINDKDTEMMDKPIKDISFKKKPFTSPKF